MKILLVDDEPLARQRLAALVHELGGHDIVAEAANGREAVELAGEHAAEVVLLDVAMPVMDGLEAARHLATLPSPPALVFCTAFDQHALAAFEAAAVDYLVKPVHHRHRHVEQHHLGGVFAGQLDRLAAIAGLGHDVVAAQFVHQRGKPLAGERFVVDEQDLHAASMPCNQSPRSRTSSPQTLCGIG